MTESARPRAALSLVAVLLAVAAPCAYVATLDVPFLRRSGLLLFGLLVLALASAARARAMRAPWARTAVTIVFAVTVWVAWLFFLKARLPADRAPQVGERAPAFVATAYDGAAFDLTAALAKGPILLVFFRGFW